MAPKAAPAKAPSKSPKKAKQTEEPAKPAKRTQTTFSEWKDLTPSKASFEVDDVDVSVLNAVRRTILSDIPNVAFRYDPFDKDESSIVFHVNTGALHNEFLGHRLALIPLCFTEKQIDAVLGGQARYRFALKKHNTTKSDIVDVLTSDFVVYLDDRPLDDREREAILPADPFTRDHILITRLKPGEALHADCVPAAGTAKEHAAWCPVSLCVFHNRTDPQAAAVAFAQRLEAMRESRSTDGKPQLTEEEELEYERRFYILDAQRCFQRNKYGEPRCFTFCIETECRMRPAYLVAKALRLLTERVKRLQYVFGKDDDAFQKDGTVAVAPLAEDDASYDVCIAGEDHTLGNLLQSLMFEFYNREADELTYVGYYQRHPLEDSVSLRLTPKEPTDVAGCRAFLAQACAKVAGHLLQIAEDWTAFSGVEIEASSAETWQAFVRSS